jgi:surfeit locus 1 family protein
VSRRAALIFVIISIAMAAGCIRLGIWQLDRRQLRLASNAWIESRMAAAPVDVSRIPRDTTKSRFANAIVTGTPDFEHEVLLTHRGNDGAPGVDILTPVRLAGTDTAVLVNRGWVYSPDGMHIELHRWREPDTTFTGYVDAFQSAPDDTVREGGIRRASYEAIAREIPYPILGFYVVAMKDSAARRDSAAAGPGVVRLRPPKLDDGPHLSYAFQWFGFATIALVGAAIVAARSMHKKVSS